MLGAATPNRSAIDRSIHTSSLYGVAEPGQREAEVSSKERRICEFAIMLNLPKPPATERTVGARPSSKNIEANSHGDCLNPAGRAELSHRVLNMKIDRVFADS